MESHEVVRVEEYYKPLDRWFHANIYPSSQGISIFAQDVTERRLHQDRLLLSEKLAATGRLAATIAHEINNPLESVLNLIYLARISRRCSAKIRETLLPPKKKLTRVSHIARHTLGFYRDTSCRPKSTWQPWLRRFDRLREQVARRSIEVRKDFAALPPVEALRGEMHQGLLQFVFNAIDAMRDGGILTIVLREAEENGQPRHSRSR